jgi:hypothetical protein
MLQAATGMVKLVLPVNPRHSATTCRTYCTEGAHSESTDSDACVHDFFNLNASGNVHFDGLEKQPANAFKNLQDIH